MSYLGLIVGDSLRVLSIRLSVRISVCSPHENGMARIGRKFRNPYSASPRRQMEAREHVRKNVVPMEDGVTRQTNY